MSNRTRMSSERKSQDETVVASGIERRSSRRVSRTVGNPQTSGQAQTQAITPTQTRTRKRRNTSGSHADAMIEQDQGQQREQEQLPYPHLIENIQKELTQMAKEYYGNTMSKLENSANRQEELQNLRLYLNGFVGSMLNELSRNIVNVPLQSAVPKETNDVTAVEGMHLETEAVNGTNEDHENNTPDFNVEFLEKESKLIQDINAVNTSIEHLRSSILTEYLNCFRLQLNDGTEQSQSAHEARNNSTDHLSSIKELIPVDIDEDELQRLLATKSQILNLLEVVHTKSEEQKRNWNGIDVYINKFIADEESHKLTKSILSTSTE